MKNYLNIVNFQATCSVVTSTVHTQTGVTISESHLYILVVAVLLFHTLDADVIKVRIASSNSMTQTLVLYFITANVSTCYIPGVVLHYVYCFV